jgi:hypothetical protein
MKREKRKRESVISDFNKNNKKKREKEKRMVVERERG